MYASRLLCSSSGVAVTLISSIIRHAASNNARMRIGGELSYDAASGTVVQILEGPATAVRALYAKIAGDLRHEHCTLLAVEQISAADRKYPQWGMRHMADEGLRATLGEAILKDLARLHRRWQRGVRTSKERTDVAVSMDVPTGQGQAHAEHEEERAVAAETHVWHVEDDEQAPDQRRKRSWLRWSKDVNKGSPKGSPKGGARASAGSAAPGTVVV